MIAESAHCTFLKLLASYVPLKCDSIGLTVTDNLTVKLVQFHAVHCCL